MYENMLECIHTGAGLSRAERQRHTEREREREREREKEKRDGSREGGREKECLCVVHVCMCACSVKSWMKLLQLNCRWRRGKKNDFMQFSLVLYKETLENHFASFFSQIILNAISPPFYPSFPLLLGFSLLLLFVFPILSPNPCYCCWVTKSCPTLLNSWIPLKRNLKEGDSALSTSNNLG